MDMKGKRVLLYIRVSTDEQARHGESVLDQAQALHKWVEDRGCIVAGEFRDEGFSARKTYKSRPALASLLSAVEQGEADAVVFTKLDRWFRNLKDYYKVEEVLERCGVFWMAILEDYETKTSAGRFKVNLMLSIAEHEADQTSERIKFTFAQKRARGEIVGASMPRGYKLVNKKPVKDPDTQRGMEAFWQTWFDTGRTSAAMEAADRCGVHFASYNTAANILKNAANYAGLIQGVPCEPYITEQQRDMVLCSRNRSPRRPTGLFLLHGLVKCGTCGGTFGGHKQKYIRADGTRSAYYNCTRAHHTRNEKCSNKVCQSEEKLEQHLLSHIEGAMAEAIAASETQEQQEKNAADPGKELAAIKVKMARLTDVYLDGLISKEEYKRRRAGLEEQIKLVAPVHKPQRKTSEELKSALPEGWREIYTGLDMPHKQAFWRRIIEEIRVFEDRTITLVVRG